MYRTKRARSVIHSIAHHGVSALSFLHPRLGEECKEQGYTEVQINVLGAAISTADFKASKETNNAINSLRDKFYKIAKAEGIIREELAEVHIRFGFEKGHWPSLCIAEMSDKKNQSVSIKVDGFGNKYGLLSKYAYKYE